MSAFVICTKRVCTSTLCFWNAIYQNSQRVLWSNHFSLNSKHQFNVVKSFMPIKETRESFKYKLTRLHTLHIFYFLQYICCYNQRAEIFFHNVPSKINKNRQVIYWNIICILHRNHCQKKSDNLYLGIIVLRQLWT